MRLIDADEFIKKFRYADADTEDEKVMCATVRKMIKEQPTAYDVDKVAYQLDKASGRYECEEQGRELVEMVDRSEALEIVKAGGIDEPCCRYDSKMTNADRIRCMRDEELLDFLVENEVMCPDNSYYDQITAWETWLQSSGNEAADT